MSARILSLFLIVALLAACSPSPTSVASASISGPLVPVGEPEIRDLGPTTETVWNCGSGGGTVVKHPSMSVVTNYAVEWEVGGATGVGLTIGEGVIPGGVDLSASLEGHYVTSFEQGTQQGTGWDLPAEPNTIVVYTLMWREVWQGGRVDVRLANQSVVPVNVRYRTGIQSEIVGKQQQTCGEGQVTPIRPWEVPTHAPVPTQQATIFSENCAIGTPLPHRVPVVGQPWTLPNGGWIVVNFWSNEPGVDQTEHKLLLGPDDPRSFLGGGSAWQWPKECEDVARDNYRDNPLPPITLEELMVQGLVR